MLWRRILRAVVAAAALVHVIAATLRLAVAAQTNSCPSLFFFYFVHLTDAISRWRKEVFDQWLDLPRVSFHPSFSCLCKS